MSSFKKLHDEVLDNLQLSSNIIRMLKPRRVGYLSLPGS